MDKSPLTAISRKTLPLPTRWLMKHGLTRGCVLDYGCGHCWKINPPEWGAWDKYHRPGIIALGWDTIICNYVMCVLPPRKRKEVLRNIQLLLKPDGIAYISVNKRQPKQGWGLNSRGTYQGRGMNLRLKEVYSNANFRILKMTKL